MLCRSTSTTLSLSCYGGNNGGQQMSYDALRRLLSWQNAPGSSPTASEQYAYDGEGNRVWQQATSVNGNRVWQQATSVNGSTTTTTATAYVLGIDELTTTSVTGQQAVTTNVRTYPLPGGHAVAVRDGTGLYDSAVDLVGTPIATLHLDDGTLMRTAVDAGASMAEQIGQQRPQRQALGRWDADR